jgi:Uncharacterised protein family (UPF0175)
MTISFELPQEIEQQIRQDMADPNRDARESCLVDLYRQDLITHYQLAQALGLSRYETDGFVKRHLVSILVTAEEMRAQAASMREARPE